MSKQKELDLAIDDLINYPGFLSAINKSDSSNDGKARFDISNMKWVMDDKIRKLVLDKLELINLKYAFQIVPVYGGAFYDLEITNREKRDRYKAIPKTKTKRDLYKAIHKQYGIVTDAVFHDGNLDELITDDEFEERLNAFGAISKALFRIDERTGEEND